MKLTRARSSCWWLCGSTVALRHKFLLATTRTSSRLVARAESSSSDKNDSTTTRIFLLRHGQTDANANGVIQGSSDASRLTDLGRLQARELGQAMAAARVNDNDEMLPGFAGNNGIGSIYVSPLSRAQETLQIVVQQQQPQLAQALCNDITTLRNLREIDFYDWENRHQDDLSAAFPQEWQAWKDGDPYLLRVLESTPVTSNVRYPLLELWDRADQVWQEIQAMEQRKNIANINNSILVVAHGSLGQALLATAMGWDATSFRRFPIPNCGLVQLEWNNFAADHTTNASTRSHPRATRWRRVWPKCTEWAHHRSSSSSNQ